MVYQPNVVNRPVPPPTVGCTLCGDPTDKPGTKLCDRCWELKSRIERDPALALKILTRLVEEEL